MLHLTGYDHETLEEGAERFTKQDEILEEMGISR
jgi:ssRNA-specific RNase YbeY (16S rRNA maturation enzyme)